MLAQAVQDSKGKGKAIAYDETQPEALRYLQRVVDEVQAVLFDSRRQSCHGLVLNNFVSCSGFRALLAKYQLACQALFDAVDKEESQSQAIAQKGTANGEQAAARSKHDNGSHCRACVHMHAHTLGHACLVSISLLLFVHLMCHLTFASAKVPSHA